METNEMLLALIALILAVIASTLLRMSAVLTRGMNQPLRGMQSIDERLGRIADKK